MVDIFSTTIEPTTSTQKSIEPRVKKCQFGNGYMQIVGSGINNVLEKWSLSFTVNKTDKEYIDAFFRTQAGYKYFYWTPPDSLTQKKYLCPSWNVSPLGRNNYTISANFEEWAG